MVGIRTYAHALTPLLWEALNVQFQLMCLRLHLGIECRKAADKRRVLATLKNRRSTNGLKCCRDVAGSLFPLRSRELLIDAMAGGKTVFSPVVDLKYGTTIWHAVAEKICSGLVPDICPASPQDNGGQPCCHLLQVFCLVTHWLFCRRRKRLQSHCLCSPRLRRLRRR